MYRYFAICWDPVDTAQSAKVAELGRLLVESRFAWQLRLNLPGFQVFLICPEGSACQAYILKKESGVILGRLFDSRSVEDGTTALDPVLDQEESERILNSRGQRLIEHYWGHYVAFLLTKDGRRFVLRDPTGGLDCLLVELENIIFIVSDLQDWGLLKMTTFSINWEHIIAFCTHSRLVTKTTGFRQVSRLLAGECISIDRRNSFVRTSYWNPSDFYDERIIDDTVTARSALRNNIQCCVNSWASCYERIVLELSGGLDSSIVAACLAQVCPKKKVVCVHFFTEAPEGDERRYARTVAQHMGFTLIERAALADERSLEAQLDTGRYASPLQVCFQPAPELLKRRIVKELRAGTVFSGQGGDHLLQQGRSKLIAAEYAARHGITLDLFRIASEISNLTRESVWAVYAAIVSYGLFGRAFDPYMIYQPSPFFTDEIRRSFDPSTYQHPWVRQAGPLPASKKHQIAHVVDCQPFYLFPCTFAHQIHPIISQPVIECSLRIPTYVLARRGRERGLAREAFQDIVPAQIIQRQSKGITSNYFSRLLIGNLAFLRELLLDGVLVRKGIFCRRALEKGLSEQELILGANVKYLLTAIRAETWMKTWNINCNDAAR